MNDDNIPLTKADFLLALVSLKTEIKEEIHLSAKHLRGEIAKSRLETDVQYESLRHDVLGAIGDFHSLQKDKNSDYDQRILRLEVSAGYRAR